MQSIYTTKKKKRIQKESFQPRLNSIRKKAVNYWFLTLKIRHLRRRKLLIQKTNSESHQLQTTSSYREIGALRQTSKVLQRQGK